MPKISIIVPIYNAEKYLEETVNAIRLQTIKDIEIILIDDGSSDKSGFIIDKLAKEDDRIKVVHQKNKGVSVARNIGMDLAIGEFIGFADADDLMEIDMYETMYNNAINNNADLSMISPKIKNLNGKIKYFNNTKKCYLWDSKETLENFFKGNVFNIATYTKLLRKDLADKVRFEDGKAIHEDKYFTYLTIKNAKVVYFEDVCKYIYIKRENSASTSKFSKKKFDAIYFADKIFNDIKLTKDDVLIREAYVDAYITKLLILRGIYRDKDALNNFSKEKEELIKDIKKINLKKYKKFFSKQKVIEILIIQKFTSIYRIVVKNFDIMFR